MSSNAAMAEKTSLPAKRNSLPLLVRLPVAVKW